MPQPNKIICLCYIPATGCPNKNAPVDYCFSELLGHFFGDTLYYYEYLDLVTILNVMKFIFTELSFEI